MLVVAVKTKENMKILGVSIFGIMDTFLVGERRNHVRF